MNEYPPPPKPEDETNTEDNQEEFGVSQIIEKIENGETVGEGEEKILREKIESVILEEKSEEEWTVEESEMMTAYLQGVREGWFKDGDLTRISVDFDLENIKFNKFNEKAKIAKIEERQEDARGELMKQEIEVSQENISEDFEEIEKRLKDQIVEEAKAYEKLLEARSAEDIFSKEGREEMKSIINSLKKSNQLGLNLERLEYYRLACDDENLKFLIDRHHTEKDYTIRMLEEALVAYDKMLSILDKEDELLTEEERGLLTKLFELMKENPKTLLAILAILAGLGLIAAYGPGFLAGLAGEEAAEEIAKEVVKQVAEKEAARKIGLAGVGAVVGCAGLLGAIYALTDEKKRDDFMKWICGVDVPSWAKNKPEKS